MKRSAFALMMVLALLLILAAPVFAITYGTPDGNAHPNVGSMVLIAPRYFLTASHCTFDVNEYLASRPGYEIKITFDPTISASSTYYAVDQWITNPAFLEQPVGASDPGDVALALLHEAPAGITPARLPSAGLLDELKDAHVLDDTLFTAVGYGTVRDTNRTGPQGILDNLDRNRVDQEFLSLTNAWVTFSMNQATGNGGTCYGDSGGPHFIHENGVETNIVVAVTVTGDYVCKATDKDYRLDTPSARAFLGQYLTLP